MPHFIKDVEEIRQRATRKIEEGAVTESYRGDVEKTVDILNEALATEIVCVLRYLHHYFMATGVHGRAVADEFKEHADAEREHADRIAERIQQLGGKPDFNPRGLLERSASQYVEGETLADMIREDLIAERMVIEVYQDMVRYFGMNDPTTRHMIEEILEEEEQHASELADMLYIADPHTGKTEGQDPGTRPLELESRGEGRQQERGRGQQQGGQQERGGHRMADAGDGSIAVEPNPHQQRSGEARQRPVRPEQQPQRGRGNEGRADQRREQAQRQDERQHLDSGSRPIAERQNQRQEPFAGRGAVRGDRGKGGKRHRAA